METKLKPRLKSIAIAAHIATIIGGMSLSGPASAQTGDLKEKVDMLQQQIEQLRAQLDQVLKQQGATPAGAPATVSAAPAAATSGTRFVERKDGNGMTFLTRGGEVSIYANLDLSIDDMSKGLNGMTVDGVPPVGRTGWMPDISSNLSYIGLRGFQTIGAFPAKFVYQLETQIDVSASSGTSGSNSNTSDVVKGGLTSRNSFIGLASPVWGAVKIGKTDAPYKNSTSVMNPFSGMIGDYSVIMGNTGGDNRVEFGTRLNHAIWYESPVMGGLSINALISPGQNRAYDNSNLASGEGDCTGGNIPGSGGLPVACNDGSFGSAYSISAGYAVEGLYLTGAYELHRAVNRTSDLPAFDARDIANEWAAKFGAQYRMASGTTVSAIYERLAREVPSALASQNERSRKGYWLAVSQRIDAADSVHFGWAHAGRAQGDTGQHNTPGGSGSDNAANLFTLALKHQVDTNLSVYFDVAETANHSSAHYDLGAGGRGVTTDCHDASNPDTSGFDPNGGAPHCWAGGRLKGVSVGMKYAL
jgi:predicted porin